MGNQHHIIKDGKIFLLPTLGQDEREIGEVKNSEEETVQYFEKRFAVLNEKIEALKEKIEAAENKGSFLMKLLHMKESLLTYNGLGDFEDLQTTLTALEESLQGKINNNRERNITVKKDIIARLKPFIESDNWTEDFDKVKEIQAQWNKTGKAAEHEEVELTAEFKTEIEKFFKKPVEQLSAIEKELVSTRTQEYEFIIEDANKLLVGKLKDNLRAFKELQSKWKELKEIPSHIYEPLIVKYKELGDRYFTALKARTNNGTRQSRPQPRIDVTAEWERIASESEKLFLAEDMNLAIRQTKKLQYELKELKKAARKKGFRGENKVRDAFEYVFEKQYIEYRVKSKTENFSALSQESQQKELIKTVSYLIQKNEEEIKQIELNKEKMVFNETNTDFARMFDSRLSSHLRKLKAKQRYLSELK